MVAYRNNLQNVENRARRITVQGHFPLYNKVKFSLGYERQQLITPKEKIKPNQKI